ASHTRTPLPLTPRKWNPPLRAGALPAYDLALSLLRRDSAALRAEARGVRTHLEQGQDTDTEEALRKKLAVLEVQSEVNLPEVRWRVANAMVDMSKPVHRHLVEQKWRQDGGLDLLMERLHQMHVIPDVLPAIHPTVEVRIATPGERDGVRRPRVDVEPGVFLTPKQTLEPPAVYANVFHEDTRLYTLLLIDPDVPCESAQTYTTYLHWLAPNIPLSASTRTRLPLFNAHTPYIPPHPAHGTPAHRYVLLLLPQPPRGGSGTYTLTSAALAARAPGTGAIAGPNDARTTSLWLDIPPIADDARAGFDMRAFVRRWGMDRGGGGAHMWRAVWGEECSAIYRDILKIPEPRYGRAPKPDAYADVKQARRYVA
ncbi:phosphatidylethanolamine-binding protein, partial [Infundibulicybe gibba]